jgi:oligo-1,6-glucosidase
VIPFISKDQRFPNYPSDFDGDYGKVYAAGPRLHEFIQEMHREALQPYDVMTVGEAAGVSLTQTPLLIDERRKELNMVFQFDVVSVDRGAEWWKWKPWALPDLKACYTRYEQALDRHCWNALFISNHDNPRAVSRYGDDSPAHRVRSAKLLATMLLTLKGTPFIYQGDELAMTNYPFERIEQYDDIQARNGWQEEIVDKKGDPHQYMDNLLRISRDHARTCMQWDDTNNGGFSTADRTWFVVNPNYKDINAKQAVGDANSTYHYFRQMMALRKQTPALLYGDFADLDPAHPQLFLFTRTLGDARYLIALNFSEKNLQYSLPGAVTGGAKVFGNYPDIPSDHPVGQLSLRAWEAAIYALEK